MSPTCARGAEDGTEADELRVTTVSDRDPTLQFHEQEHGGQGLDRQSGAPTSAPYRLERDRAPAKPAVVRTVSPGGVVRCRARPRGRPPPHAGHPDDSRPQRAGCRSQCVDDILRGFDQRGAVADQPMAALGQRVVDRTGQGEHLASGCRRRAAP